MDYGIVPPHCTTFASEDPAHRIATAAEALGYSPIRVADHPVFPSKTEGGYAFNPGTNDFPESVRLMERFAREAGPRN